jgi:hypothetical protein
LVKTHKAGRVRTCTLDASALSQAEQWIHQRRTEWERKLHRLGDYLAEPETDPDTLERSKP